LQLQLNASEPLSALLVFYIFPNGVTRQWQTTPFNGSLTVAAFGEGPNALLLKAVDLAGNFQLVSTPFNWTLDSTPPAVWLESTPPVVTNSSRLQLQLGTSERLASLLLAVDGLPPTVTAGVNGSTAVTVVAQGEGMHVLSVNATDVAGNVYSNATFYYWVLDTTAPSSCGASLSPAVIAEASLGGHGGLLTNGTAASLRLSASESVTFLFRLDNASVRVSGLSAASGDPAARFAFSKEEVVTGMRDGPHRVQVWAATAFLSTQHI
jgi:hypothetical protein